MSEADKADKAIAEAYREVAAARRLAPYGWENEAILNCKVAKLRMLQHKEACRLEETLESFKMARALDKVMLQHKRLYTSEEE